MIIYYAILRSAYLLLTGKMFFAESDPHDAYKIFFRKMHRHLYFVSPENIYTNKSRKPWFDREMLQLIKKRDKLCKLFLQSWCPEALKKFMNFVTKQRSVAKKQYIFNHFNSSNQRSENVWKVLNSVSRTNNTNYARRN